MAADRDLGRFLYAEIGQQENGTPLTVLSAFARLGLDPWREAARLARLSKDDAARELARMMARLPQPCGARSSERPARGWLPCCPDRVLRCRQAFGAIG